MDINLFIEEFNFNLILAENPFNEIEDDLTFFLNIECVSDLEISPKQKEGNLGLPNKFLDHNHSDIQGYPEIKYLLEMDEEGTFMNLKNNQKEVTHKNKNNHISQPGDADDISQPGDAYDTVPNQI